MAIFGRRGSSMGRVRQQAAPAPAPAKPAGRAFGGAGKGFGSVSKAPVAAPTTRGVPTNNYGNLYVGRRRRQSAPVAPAPVPAPAPAPAPVPAPAPAPAKTYNETQLAYLRKADQALGNVAKSTYSPADLARIQQGQSKAMLQQPQQASGLKAIGQAPTVSPQAAAMKQFQGQQAAFNAANMANISKTSQVPVTPQQNAASLQAVKDAFTKQRVAPAVSQQQMAKDVVAQNAAKGQNMMKQASRDADERFLEKQAQKAKAATAPVAQVPSPPPFRKGGAVKKKTGYAKGGAVMCGASMPPAQKRKK